MTTECCNVHEKIQAKGVVSFASRVLNSSSKQFTSLLAHLNLVSSPDPVHKGLLTCNRKVCYHQLIH